MRRRPAFFANRGAAMRLAFAVLATSLVAASFASAQVPAPGRGLPVVGAWPRSRSARPPSTRSRSICNRWPSQGQHQGRRHADHDGGDGRRLSPARQDHKPDRFVCLLSDNDKVVLTFFTEQYSSARRHEIAKRCCYAKSSAIRDNVERFDSRSLQLASNGRAVRIVLIRLCSQADPGTSCAALGS